MTLVRLRKEGAAGKSLTQLVYDNFQEDVEHRVRAAGVKVLVFAPYKTFDKLRYVPSGISRPPGRISKHLADQEQIFFGTSLAYDKVKHLH